MHELANLPSLLQCLSVAAMSLSDKQTISAALDATETLVRLLVKELPDEEKALA